MNASRRSWAAAGFQAGLFGGFVLLTLMAIVSVADRSAWWSYPNVLGAALNGRVPMRGPGWHTVAGAALQCIASSLAGCLLGWIAASLLGSARGVTAGLIWGAATYWASSWLLRVFSPLAASYLPARPLLMAHLFYGAAVALSSSWVVAALADPPDGPKVADSDERRDSLE